jgi:hypothetical protein
MIKEKRRPEANRAAKSRRGDGINSVRSLAVDDQCAEYCPTHDLRCTQPAHRFGQHSCPEELYNHRFYALAA